jgi:hypothetical protein
MSSFPGDRREDATGSPIRRRAVVEHADSPPSASDGRTADRVATAGRFLVLRASIGRGATAVG